MHGINMQARIVHKFDGIKATSVQLSSVTMMEMHLIFFINDAMQCLLAVGGELDLMLMSFHRKRPDSPFFFKS